MLTYHQGGKARSSFPGWSWAVGREFGRAGCKRKWIPSSSGTNITSAPCLVANQTVHFGWLTCSSAEVPCAQITRCSQGANILIWVMLLLLLLSTGPIDSICSSLSIPLFHHSHPLSHPPSLISACPVQGHEKIYKKYHSLWGSPVLFHCSLSQDKSKRAAVRLCTGCSRHPAKIQYGIPLGSPAFSAFQVPWTHWPGLWWLLGFQQSQHTALHTLTTAAPNCGPVLSAPLALPPFRSAKASHRPI